MKIISFYFTFFSYFYEITSLKEGKWKHLPVVYSDSESDRNVTVFTSKTTALCYPLPGGSEQENYTDCPLLSVLVTELAQGTIVLTCPIIAPILWDPEEVGVQQPAQQGQGALE